MKNTIKFPIVLFCFLTFFSCGKEPAIQTMSLSGTISGDAIADHPGKTVMLIIIKGESLMGLTTTDLSSLSAGMDEIIEYISIDRSTLSFDVDLTDKGVNVGDEIAIVAFVDVNDNSSIPFPNKGDFLGFYLDMENMSFTYTLQSGANTGINVEITREIFDFDASVEGTLSGTEMGNVTLIAYADEIPPSLDVSELNIDAVIGYDQIVKTKEIQDFTLDILPMGENVPIEGVYIFAILDKNGNGKPGSGDLIGYIPGDDGFTPRKITINEGVTKDLHLEFLFTIPTAAGYSIPVTGTLEMPDGEYFHKDSPPLYLLVVAMDDLSSMSSLSNITSLFTNDEMKIFYVPLESSDASDQGQSYVYFNVDLSGSSFVAGDEVMVAALWDKDSDTDGTIPSPSAGDRFCFFNNKATYQLTITLAEEGTAIENAVPSFGDNEFKLNKIWYDHDVSIRYYFEPEADQPNLDYKTGDMIMVAAVHQDGLPINFQSFLNPTMDIDYVIGIQMIEIDSDTFNGKTFDMGLMPFQLEGLVNEPGFNIEDVGLFAILGMEELEFSGNGDYTIGHYHQNGPLGTPWILPLYFDISDETSSIKYLSDRGIMFFNLLKF